MPEPTLPTAAETRDQKETQAIADAISDALDKYSLKRYAGGGSVPTMCLYNALAALQLMLVEQLDVSLRSAVDVIKEATKAKTEGADNVK